MFRVVDNKSLKLVKQVFGRSGLASEDNRKSLLFFNKVIFVERRRNPSNLKDSNVAELVAVFEDYLTTGSVLIKCASLKSL